MSSRRTLARGVCQSVIASSRTRAPLDGWATRSGKAAALPRRGRRRHRGCRRRDRGHQVLWRARRVDRRRTGVGMATRDARLDVDGGATRRGYRASPRRSIRGGSEIQTTFARRCSDGRKGGARSRNRRLDWVRCSRRMALGDHGDPRRRRDGLGALTRLGRQASATPFRGGLARPPRAVPPVPITRRSSRTGAYPWRLRIGPALRSRRAGFRSVLVTMRLATARAPRPRRERRSLVRR